jgi:hypothetical protein
MVKTRDAEQRDFLRENIRPGCIVMTHFAPSSKSIPEAERAHGGAPYYAIDLEALIADVRPAIWVHGRIHSKSDYRIGSTRILCNPAGYDGTRSGSDVFGVGTRHVSPAGLWADQSTGPGQSCAQITAT